LPTENYLKFMADFRQLKGEWEIMVRDFIVGYPQLVSVAQSSLGALYDPADYPAPSTIGERFRMTISIMPVPSTDFRVAIGDEELEKIRADVESRVKAAGDKAMGDLWKRLYDRVKVLAERLADPQARFHESLLENANDLCEILPRLNIADDPKLEQMRCELQSMLKGKNVDMLRTSPTARESTAKSAQAIVDKMGAFMGGIA